ncbi:hypothetical protein FKP32DRAFT_1602304 [Trametes sanguinea]|nr:hypothetical protein FKP32DRAFT_1602304 [Trametes sanguinea]
MQPSPLPNFESSGAGFLPDREDLGLQLADCTGTMPFTASEVLRGIAADAPFARNTSQDLQSLLWTIIFIAYHSAIRAAEDELESQSTSPVKIDHRRLRKEYHTLFPSTTPEELADSRRAAFGSSTPDDAYEGIGHLFLYASAVDEIRGHPYQGLILLVMGAWSILRRCEPQALVPRRMPSSALRSALKELSEDVASIIAAARASASGPLHASGYRPSQTSLTFNHDKLLQLLGEVLEELPRVCFQGMNQMTDPPGDMGLDTDHRHGCSADANHWQST